MYQTKSTRILRDLSDLQDQRLTPTRNNYHNKQRHEKSSTNFIRIVTLQNFYYKHNIPHETYFTITHEIKVSLKRQSQIIDVSLSFKTYPRR